MNKLTYVLYKDEIIIDETDCCHAESAIDEFSEKHPIFTKGYRVSVKEKNKIDYEKVLSRFKS
jgi:hypothetical protein